MIILKIFGVMLLISFVYMVYSDLKDSYNTVIKRESEQYNRIFLELRKENEKEKKQNETRKELEKQLNGVRYQIKLLETLDNFRSGEFRTEKDVKQALTLEKQYNALWTKERKIMRQLEELEKLSS